MIDSVKGKFQSSASTEIPLAHSKADCMQKYQFPDGFQFLLLKLSQTLLKWWDIGQ